jgi:lipoate-protein ligase A
MNKWRLIIDGAAEGYKNMAVDEAILQACNMGYAPSTIRFYEWTRPELSIGYLQDYNKFKSVTMPVIRRITGGRAVIHCSEITYSIICGCDNPLFSRKVYGSYEVVSHAILNALKDMSIDASIVLSVGRSVRKLDSKESCFSSPSRYEIMANGRKIVGSAQRRYKRAFLQQGSIILDIDSKLVEGVFGRDAAEEMIGLNYFKEVDKDKLRKSCIDRIEDALEVRLYKSELKKQENFLKDRLVERKYTSVKWNKEGLYQELYRAF